MTIDEISSLIRRRRAIYPKTYIPGRAIEPGAIELLLENANWAPSHKLTEPWRFIVFHSEESRKELGDFLAEDYRKKNPGDLFSEEKWKKMGENAMRSGAVIAIVMARDPQDSLPEFEEIAAVAMAVQNMWLSCTAMGLGCYWSTPSAILQANDFLELKPGERSLGLFYIGYHNMPDIPGKRKPVTEKTRWK